MTANAPSAVRKVTAAVSTSPTAPISGSTRQLALAKTSTGSSPRSQRAMSKSWIIMSRNSPPETLTYSMGGGAGSRLVIWTSSTRPMRPSRKAWWRAAKLGSKRRLNPIMSGAPRRSASARQRSTRSSDQVHRFLAEDGLAGPRRSLDQVGVGIGRTGDDHRVDLGIGERHLGVGHRRAVRRGKARRRRVVDIDDVPQPGLRVGGHVGGVDLADAAGAELTDLKHEISLGIIGGLSGRSPHPGKVPCPPAEN